MAITIAVQESARGKKLVRLDKPTLEEGSRKFLLVKKDQDIFLILGPILDPWTDYSHSSITNGFCEEPWWCREARISGGGYFELYKRVVTFSGGSYDYGQFDREALQKVKRELVTFFGCKVKIEEAEVD